MKVKLVGAIAIVTSRAQVEGTNDGVSGDGNVPVYEDLPASAVRAMEDYQL